MNRIHEWGFHLARNILVLRDLLDIKFKTGVKTKLHLFKKIAKCYRDPVMFLN